METGRILLVGNKAERSVKKMKEYIIELSSDDENALSIITKAYNLHELIRCKDCKFFISEGHYCKIRGIGRPLEPDDFCSDGKSVK